ncbi:hypothetical protein [Streptomyces sp. NPDC010273]|uniref:hypothetical protein n=1 Tax=Streptomyces sp. NPDC010273 TaxID=3364829 RepID=UPI0036F14687
MFQYESDEKAVSRAIEAAVAEIEHGTARTIASWFNGPGHVGTFVSTGAMPVGEAFPTDVLMYELRKGLDPATERANVDALEALETYLTERECYDDLDRVDGWSDMWVRKHVDRPHHDGALPECWCADEDA